MDWASELHHHYSDLVAEYQYDKDHPSHLNVCSSTKRNVSEHIDLYSEKTFICTVYTWSKCYKCYEFHVCYESHDHTCDFFHISKANIYCWLVIGPLKVTRNIVWKTNLKFLHSLITWQHKYISCQNTRYKVIAQYDIFHTKNPCLSRSRDVPMHL